MSFSDTLKNYVYFICDRELKNLFRINLFSIYLLFSIIQYKYLKKSFSYLIPHFLFNVSKSVYIFVLYCYLEN